MDRIRTAMVAATCTTLSLGALALPAHAAALPTPTAAAVAPRAAKPSSLTYVVKSGDYLAGIATKLGVKIGDLLSVNKITVTSVIVPGQALIVPEGGALPTATPVAAAAAPAAPYVVVNGDYLAGIAKKLGVTLPALLTTNKLTATSTIHPGTQLTVPAGGKLPAPTTAAVASQGPVPAAPAATATASYTVVSGDFLVGIAAKNGVTLKALLAANNLITTSSIQPGRQLKLPPATLPIPTAATGITGAAAGGAPATAGTTSAAPSAGAQSIATVIAFLQAQVGKPYVFNTEGPDTYDCSGLVTAAYKQIGINLPHQSLLQSMKGTAVDWRTQALQPGDLIFQFSTANPTVISHVGIAIDATHWIQAAGSGIPVKIGPVPNDDRIQAVRRIVQG